MHAVVMQSLEEYLAGALEPAAHRNIDSHLSACEACREEIRSMQEASQYLRTLRSEDAVVPLPGFYARVMQQIDRSAAPSVASLLGLGFAFGRRLVFASLVTLAVLGSYLISRETAYPNGPSVEAVLAQQDSPAFESAPAQDNMLVTLTAYDH